MPGGPPQRDRISPPNQAQRFAAQYDGAGSAPNSAPGSPRPPPGAPRIGMSPGRLQGSRSGTPAHYPAPLGYDPGRSQTTTKEPVITNRRVELPSAAYQLGKTVSRHICFNFFHNSMMLE